MTAFTQILCPVDFSAFSRHALLHAVQIARWYQSRLTVLFVYPPAVPPPPILFGGLPGPIPPPPFPAETVSPDRTRDEVAAELAKFVAGVNTSGVEARIHARDGSPVRTILEVAAALQSDLIVLGTHGHSGVDRLVLGSVTEKVLRKARCPVLTVPPPVTEPPEDALRIFTRILCPIDFSDASLKALEHALALAKEADAGLLLMHVIEEAAKGGANEQHILTKMRETVPADARMWCTPRELVLTGKPYEHILRIARDEDIHLIVMGVHGRNPFDLMFFGSTTNHVVRASSCPVLTVKVQ